MTENENTKRRLPTPARNEKPVNPKTGQTDGSSSAVAGSRGRVPIPDALEEQRKTEKGYEDLRRPKK